MAKRNHEWSTATRWDGFFTQDKDGGETQCVSPETVMERLVEEGFSKNTSVGPGWAVPGLDLWLGGPEKVFRTALQPQSMFDNLNVISSWFTVAGRPGFAGPGTRLNMGVYDELGNIGVFPLGLEPTTPPTNCAGISMLIRPKVGASRELLVSWFRGQSADVYPLTTPVVGSQLGIILQAQSTYAVFSSFQLVTSRSENGWESPP